MYNLKSKLEDEELDLSMMQIEDVPVKEIVSIIQEGQPNLNIIF